MSGQGTLPEPPRFDVTVTTKIGYGDRQRIAMGWQEPRTLNIKGVPAWTLQQAQAKVLAKLGKGWEIVG